MFRLRVVACVILMIALGSCTIAYPVTAAFKDDWLFFLSDDDRRTSYPWCWNDLAIVDEEGRPVWEFEVPYGAFNGREDCGPNFPVRYGQAPERAETIMPPQRLVIGRTYGIIGQAAGMLEGAFKIDRIDDRLKIQNLPRDSSEESRIRDAYYAWQRDRDPPRISKEEPPNAAFVVQRPPDVVAKNAAAGASGRDGYTWVLHPDEWWNLPSLAYQDLSGRQVRFNLWCRYTGGPIYARVPPPATRGSPLELRSGSDRLEARLAGAGNPERRDRIDAVLPGDSRLFESFARTGELAVETGERRFEVNAINRDERAVVKRFFDLCQRSIHRPLSGIGPNDG